MTELQGLSIERLLRFLRYMLTLRPQYNDYSCQSIVKKRLKMLIYTRTKSRAYGRHSAFAPFFASTWLHSLRYAGVSN